MTKTPSSSLQSSNRQGLHAIYIAAFTYLILHLAAGLFEPPYLLWGVRFFPYLPEALVVVPVFSIVAVSFVYFRRHRERKQKGISRRSGILALSAVCLTAILFANIDAFVLGDGENILFQIVNPGEQQLVREPLVLTVAKGLKETAKAIYPVPDLRGVTLNGSHTPADLAQVIHAEHALTLLGIISLLFALYGSWLLLSDWFSDGSEILYAGVFLLGSGFLALYAGYAEYYGAAIAFTILLHALILRSLKKKTLSWSVAVVYGISCTSYVGMLAYLPVVLLGFWFVWPRSLKHLLLHVIVVGIVITAIFFTIGYSPSGLWTYFIGSTETSSSHVIPFGGPASIKHAYLAFSPYHFLDLANLLLLVNPLAIVILLTGIVALLRKQYSLERTDALLLLSAACSFVMMFLVNCDIGMVADWDLLAPFTVPPVLSALWIVAKRAKGGIRLKTLKIGAMAVAAHAVLWMSILAIDDASIARLQAVQNQKTFSVDGLHYTTMNIIRYYGRTGESGSELAVLQRLTDEVLPGDPRAYYTLAQMHLDQRRNDLAFHTLAKAIDRGAADYRIEALYGKMLHQKGDPKEAVLHFKASLEKLPVGYSDSTDVSIKTFYLGQCYVQLDSSAQAIEALRTALRWDPENAYAGLTLAQLYLRGNRRSEAIVLIQHVARFETDPALRHYADSLLQVVGGISSFPR